MTEVKPISPAQHADGEHAEPSEDTASSKRRQAKSSKVPKTEEGPLTLSYSLAELPSAQHRAGLAGLILFIRWMQQQGTTRGVCDVVDADDAGATLRLDLEGVRGLFDELYAASQEEKHENQLRKDKRSGEPIPPIRVETKEISVSEKGGKAKTKTETKYYYPAIVPKAPFLVALEPTRSEDGPWLKLWREMLWSILRGVPATRSPYEDRAAGNPTSDAEDAFGALSRPLIHGVDLSSTLYLGAQACTAENVSFRDRARYQFVLHFWPLIAQIYVPQVLVDAQKNEQRFVGYAIAIPDVAKLLRFTSAWKSMMEHRSADRIAYRPKQAVVDLAMESALDLSERLQVSLTALEGEKSTRRTVLGIEVLHMNKEGNNIRLLSSDRIDPTPLLLREYTQLKGACRDHVFRRQRLLNLVKGRPWFAGFDALAATLPYKTQFFGSPWFRHDALTFFEQQRQNMSEQNQDPGAMAASSQDHLSQIIYRLTQSYVRRKTESKNKKRDDVARDAFLAVRSRTGSDFVEYFCGTLCSVPQAISSADFQRIGQALRDEKGRAELRTLTLLALSAAAFVGFDKGKDAASPTTPESDPA